MSFYRKWTKKLKAKKHKKGNPASDTFPMLGFEVTPIFSWVWAAASPEQNLLGILPKIESARLPDFPFLPN